jgi:hypothetical protein
MRMRIPSDALFFLLCFAVCSFYKCIRASTSLKIHKSTQPDFVLYNRNPLCSCPL